MVRKLLALVLKAILIIQFIKMMTEKNRYINRHKDKEEWGLSGIKTPGFYAKNILWNKKTIQESVNDLNKKYNSVKFIYRK
jgi:hypothetical protein